MPRADWVKQALKASGKPLPGFTALDYGAGLPQLPKAVELLAEIADAREGDVLYDIDLSVESPLAVGGDGEAAYWRTRFPPTDDVTFTLKPVFAPGAEATDIPKFSKRINLSCDADWIKLNQTQTYLRSEQTARVQAKYDASKLTEPGLHADGRSNRRTRVADVEQVVFALRRCGETAEATRLANGFEAIVAAGQNLVDICLMTDIPQQVVLLEIKHAMQRHREFDHAQVTGEVSARCADDVDDALPHFAGELVELLDRQGL